jgi:proton-dependent oligopeptide transporter, POT family
MFKGHPKGLIIASIANMGERFGYYTMFAICVLFLQAKYGFDPNKTGYIWSGFLFAVYFLPLLGGLIADRWLGYGKTITLGIVVMFIGYILLAIPLHGDTSFYLVISALFTIALGTGLFKGNLQALVGNLYDDPKYSNKRDSAFIIFYMCINIGAMFAPTAAEAMNNYVLKASHFTYDSRIPALAHKLLENRPDNIDKYLDIARLQDPTVTAETLKAFSTKYIDALGNSYHYAFGIACISLIISAIVFLGFKKYYKHADMTEKQKSADENTRSTVVDLPVAEIKRRVFALFMVYIVVIFFWMSFQQNGFTMTMFARDYTVPSVGKFSNLWFDLFALLPILLAVVGLIVALRRTNDQKTKYLGISAFIVFGLLAYYRFSGYSEVNSFTPQKFQHFNPFFIVALSPVVLALFARLREKGIEPSSPRKIGIGMIITVIAFSILIVGSIGLPSPKEMNFEVSNILVSPYWLIATYLMLTVAELFLSPIGISFVSQVAPPKYKGLAQGGWFAATSVGNLGVGIMGMYWSKVSLATFWSILVICCTLSAIFIFSIIKRLEQASK